ncbi:TRAP transporter substrate-binding protein [Variovorax sp. KK3]|uniref:TRAP transporter substrate-binding protein n=1 Tax=Variovorax sp. KK3 TaxID=1855728 RepID=UPI00097BE4D2|nr:TRAP transporter substrate-binding protein [Variovorax sp. KK3]
MTPTISRRALLKGGSASLLALPLVRAHAADAQFNFKYAHNAPVSHPLHIHADKACAQIREQTGGKVAIEVFPNNQLGGDTDMLSQLRSGAIQFQTLSPLILSNLVPSASMSGLGFVFSNYDQVWTAMDGDLGAYVRAQIAKTGLVAMEKIYDNGFRQITTSNRPIRTAEDVRGLKIRVPVSPLWTSLFKALGAAPAGINWAEAYLAMQSKVVDAQENALGIVSIAKLWEVQKYCSETNHVWDGIWFLANGKAWQSMPANLQEVCARNFNEQALAQRVTNRRLNESLASELQAKGMVFNKPDLPSFTAALRRAGFYQEWKQKYGSEGWALLEKHVGSLA